ncbi:hypothetical protein SAMN05216198_0103 [Halopseudomonas litoralis]|uniref:Energy transducer TonB n=1 Tax=Halopseudomonas litoralis TaxID=797277 RepID=A0A1H1L6K6_9GAMM|nr:hypothetical protein [Halopseudomonas litoralis]SDR69970.1 hypothetical protein SAMN05216198_0103 [Halopseudomonas litoralis]
MQESIRLDYLAAMGVVGWVPRYALPHAAFRIPPALPELPDAAVDAAQATESAPSTLAESVATRKAVASARAKIIVRPTKPEPVPAAVLTEPVAEPVAKPAPLESFYLQLWMAGPCALLIETPEPGLESASPGLRLLKDILRAVRLPQTPHLYADFHWPMNRNPQFDRSAGAASLALQAFMQGRLESEPVVSIGCFGTYPRLLLGPELDEQDLPYGREEALEHLPPAWFSPTLEILMQRSSSKAQLWQQLKRVMSRWQAAQ